MPRLRLPPATFGTDRRRSHPDARAYDIGRYFSDPTHGDHVHVGFDR